MHTKRSASTSCYKRKESNLVFIRKFMELSTKMFEHLLFGTYWKTAHVLLYRNKINNISRPGEPSPALGEPGPAKPVHSPLRN